MKTLKISEEEHKLLTEFQSYMYNRTGIKHNLGSLIAYCTAYTLGRMKMLDNDK